ncbi:MAG: translation initiation factor IF-2 N-terminal domain-containing protein, partial [Oscillospiraceae bacterium]
MITDKYKLHEVAKDLNVNSKEVIDLLNKHSDTPKKAQTALTNEELNLVFEHYTQNNQVKDFDEYFASGKTEKPTPKKEETKEATASKPVNTVQQQEENMDNKQNKQPQEQQPTAQTKPQEQPVAAQNKVQAESAPVAQQPKAKEQAPVTA